MATTTFALPLPPPPPPNVPSRYSLLLTAERQLFLALSLYVLNKMTKEQDLVTFQGVYTKAG